MPVILEIVPDHGADLRCLETGKLAQHGVVWPGVGLGEISLPVHVQVVSAAPGCLGTCIAMVQECSCGQQSCLRTLGAPCLAAACAPAKPRIVRIPDARDANMPLRCNHSCRLVGGPSTQTTQCSVLQEPCRTRIPHLSLASSALLRRWCSHVRGAAGSG